MENTIIDSMIFLNKSLEKNEITLTDEQRKDISNIMYYYAKECSINSLHSKLADSDILLINNESKLIKEEILIIKSSLHKIELSQDIITKLTP